MNNRFISRAMMLTAAALLPLTAVGQDQPELVGVWEGNIRMPASEQAVTLTIEAADGRELTGTINIPAQGEEPLSLGDIEIRDQYVSFEVVGLSGDPLFDGALSVDGNRISGNFSQSGAMFPFELSRRAEANDSGSDDTSVLAGVWEGTLDVGGFTMQLRVQVPSDPQGGVSVMIGSPGQEAREMGVDSLTLLGDSVRLSVLSLGAFYAGTLNENGNAITGTWRQADARLPLTLERRD